MSWQGYFCYVWDLQVNKYLPDDEVASIIGSHMWPFNFTIYPKTKEAHIVGLADTIIATKEAFFLNVIKRKE